MSTDKDAPGNQQPSPDPSRTRRRRRIDTEALLHDIYECALHPDGWDRTLTQIRQYLNASAINLIGLEVASFGNPFLFTSNIPIDYGKEYQRHWYHEDPWVLGARNKRLNRGGETLTGGMLARFSDDLMERRHDSPTVPSIRLPPGSGRSLGLKSQPLAFPRHPIPHDPAKRNP